MRRHLTPANVILGAILLWAGWHLLDWAVLKAVFRPDAAACHALEGAGACWGVVAEKYRVIFFGRYPVDEQWRPLLAIVLMLGLLIVSTLRRFQNRRLPWIWLAGLALFLLLLKGGLFGLENVDTPRWGGLPLTLILTVFGLAGAFPLAVLLALPAGGVASQAATGLRKLLIDSADRAAAAALARAGGALLADYGSFALWSAPDTAAHFEGPVASSTANGRSLHPPVLFLWAKARAKLRSGHGGPESSGASSRLGRPQKSRPHSVPPTRFGRPTAAFPPSRYDAAEIAQTDAGKSVRPPEIHAVSDRCPAEGT